MTRNSFSTALLMAALVLFALPGLAAAQSQDSESATASATIMRSISLTKQADLSFGTIIASAVAGSVTVDAESGTQSDTGGASTFQAGNRAQFAVNGEPSFAFSVTYPNNVTLTNPTSDTMSASLVSDLTDDQGNLDSAGAANFSIGGTLNVAANQPSGAYLGTFEVTVAYQ
jgi:hypothetical protein